MEEKQDYTEAEKWKLFGTMFEQHKRMKKIIRTVTEAAAKEYPSLHVAWLFRIQDAIWENNGTTSIDVSALVEFLEESPQNLSRSLRVLEKEKLLERHTDPFDRRKTYIVVTDFGTEVLRKTGHELVGFITELLNTMGYDRMKREEAEFEAMLDLMEQSAHYRDAVMSDLKDMDCKGSSDSVHVSGKSCTNKQK